MKPRIWTGMVVVPLMLGVGKLDVIDSATLEQAIIVEAYFKDDCRLHNIWPAIENVENRFPELYPNRQWHHWPSETWSVASFHYPMTLPLPSAPGRSTVPNVFL